MSNIFRKTPMSNILRKTWTELTFEEQKEPVGGKIRSKNLQKPGTGILRTIRIKWFLNFMLSPGTRLYQTQCTFTLIICNHHSTMDDDHHHYHHLGQDGVRHSVCCRPHWPFLLLIVVILNAAAKRPDDTMMRNYN